MKKLLILSIAVFTSLAVSCNDGHEDHDHDHGDHEHEHADGDHHDDDGDDNKDHDHADGDHDHGPGIVAGPNGGRVLNAVEPHLEFFVKEDRTVQIAAVDDDLKVIPVSTQSVTVTGGDRANPTRLTFEKKGDVLISTTALPAGNDFPIVVQIKTTPDAKNAVVKFNLNLEQCPTCENKEYACTCEHAH